MIGLVPVMMLSRCEALVSKQWIGVSSSSTLTKTQQMTKHVDGTVFPYLDAGSNPASSTKPKPSSNQVIGEEEGFFYSLNKRNESLKNHH